MKVNGEWFLWGLMGSMWVSMALQLAALDGRIDWPWFLIWSPVWVTVCLTVGWIVWGEDDG